MTAPVIRPLRSFDRHALAELIYTSMNTWYESHGHPPQFTGGPRATEVFGDLYGRLEASAGVVAVNPDTGQLMASCFHHVRPRHVSLGPMTTHPMHFGGGIAKILLQNVVEIARREGKPLRLTQSAFNLDSYSLYNRAGFVPRAIYQDMVLDVPAVGLEALQALAVGARPATLDDVERMAKLELRIAGITREADLRHCVANKEGFWHASILESPMGEPLAWAVSSSHPAFRMIGPCSATDEPSALAVLASELLQHLGQAPLCLVPVQCALLARTFYGWGARNTQLHILHTLGEYQPPSGVSIPSFLPETG